MRFSQTTFVPVRRAGAIAVAIAVLCSAAIAPRAHAAAGTGTDAICTAAITLYLTPGFSARPGASAVTSKGEQGTLLCTGTAIGQRITGPGTLGVEEITQASCLSDHSSGHVSASFPTVAGPIHIVGGLTGHRLGFVEFVDIDFPQAHFSGAGPVVPTSGDCVIAPITQALVSITGTLHG
jgi:hypothetical protein